MLGGRTAEELIVGQPSSGASNDFEQATQIARTMVTEYGMTDKLGTVQLEKNGQPFSGGNYRQLPSYSEDTAKAIDQEVKRIIDEDHERAREILETHREQHKIIAEALLKYETLDEKEILSLYKTGKMPANDANQEFPSESAATFEEAKKAAEAKDAAKQRSEESNKEEDAKSETTADETTFPSEKDDQPKADSSDTNDSTENSDSNSDSNKDNNSDN